MFAMERQIIPGTVIQEMVTTLDLTATTLKVGGGIPRSLTGWICFRLTGRVAKIERAQPMFEFAYLAVRNRLETMAVHSAGDVV